MPTLTIHGMHYAASDIGTEPFKPLDHGTINEALSIFHGEEQPANAVPELGYLMVGNGAVRNDPGTQWYQTDRQPVMLNAILFQPIPFIMRELGSDLSDEERERYRFRRIEIHYGQAYICYYGLKIVIESGQPSIQKVTTINGNTTHEDYTPNPSQLTPAAISIVNNEANDSTDTVIQVTKPVNISLSDVDVAEIASAATIIANDNRAAVISEVAYCGGIDKEVTTTEGGTSVTYTETIDAITHTIITKTENIRNNTTGLDIGFRVGSSRPLVT